MKAFWTILAIILGALALGGVVDLKEGGDTPTVVGDLIITGLLALGAWGSWRQREAGKPSA